MGVPELVIQRILRHANVATTTTYYVKTTPADVKTAMEKLERQIVRHIPVTITGLTDTNFRFWNKVGPYKSYGCNKLDWWAWGDSNARPTV
jgi:hypothetical protein